VLTNSYLIADAETGEAAVIDPAWNARVILSAAAARGWTIRHLWLTHAHFDHFGGLAGVVAGTPAPVTVGLHPADLPLLQANGGAEIFGFRIEPGPPPDLAFQPGQILELGREQLEVRFTPGHTQGHVVFVSHAASLVFCGDVIFQGSIGRTDLPGGDFATLLASIRREILSLPDETRLLCGHGDETTVGIERQSNPFLN
jgi:glyoxylase-like metal-dependent hydrolase (beta-lactamase superfamily II)